MMVPVKPVQFLLIVLLFCLQISLNEARSSYRSKHRSHSSYRSKSKHSDSESSSSSSHDSRTLEGSSKVYASHTAGFGGYRAGPPRNKGMIGILKTGCFWASVARKQKVSLREWDSLDCEDKKTIDCCSPQCKEKVDEGKRQVELKKQRELAAAQHAAVEARANLELLKTLESKRKELMLQLQDAQQHATRLIQKPPELNQDDIETLSKVPETAQQEVDTLVQVAGAIVDADVQVDPKVKGDLEEIVLNDIIEATEDAAKKAEAQAAEIRGVKVQQEEENILDEEDEDEYNLDLDQILDEEDDFGAFLKDELDN